MNRSMVTLFSGGGLKAIGGIAAGWEAVGAVEYDEAIAEVYARNVSPLVTVAKVEDVDPRAYAGIDLLMASPVCTNASVANAGRGEQESDLLAAAGVCKWLRATMPRVFVMENVTQYRAFDACKMVFACLSELGYWWAADNVNFADYGVPQTRRRLIVRAMRGEMLPDLPAPTPWPGWYQALEDLLPDLEESAFAPWQLKRLPVWLTETCLVEGDAAGDRPPTRGASAEPAFTLKTASGGRVHRAFLVENINTARDATVRVWEGQSHTLTVAQCGRRVGSMPFALLCGVQGEGGELARAGVPPAPTITTAHDAAKYRAFLVSDQTSHEGTGVGLPQSDAPAQTVDTRPASKTRAFLVDGFNGRTNGQPTCGTSADPAMTVCGGSKGVHRAWLEQGVVKALDIRCLGRLQSLPDSFDLRGPRKLMSTVVGNGVPCEGVRRILEGLK